MKTLDKLRSIDMGTSRHTEDIIERAYHKSFAKICMLEIELKDLRHDLLHGAYGPINRSEVELLVEGAKQELKTWIYISTLISKERNI